MQRYCTGYKKSAFNHRTVEACGKWVKSVDDEARYFFFREEGNYHCSPCPPSYKGHPTTGTGHQNSRIYIYRILNWKPQAWTGKYNRVAMNRFCHGYKKSAFNHRNVTNCANWVRKVDREARYFFFRHEGNYHCSPCPQSYTGHPTRGTGKQNSRIYIYKIIGWTRPTYAWAKWYKRVAFNRFCHGYKKSAMNHRSVIECGRWVRQVDREAKYFFFREEGNYHCSPCPQSYTGHPTTGTGHQNSKIYIYKILGWKPPVYGWAKWYKRVAFNRYCTGYKKSNMKLRSVEACGRWVRSVDFDARYFFFREEGNYHCSPCPQSYRGHPTTGTGKQNSRIYIYRILNWRPPAWAKDYKRVATGRFCHGYKKSAFNHRSVVACANWVQSTDKDAKYFFFRQEGNYHCSPCPESYRGHPTIGTGHQNSRIYTYRIVGWKPHVYSWSKDYKRVAFNRYCHGYTANNMKTRSVQACAAHIRKAAPDAKYFFFREEGNYHCAACPSSYTGHPTTGTGHQNSKIYTYRILNWV
jgi:FPC/CPF motif-containing protein YcgG